MDHLICPLEDGERLVVQKEKTVVEKLPPYNLVGNGLTNRHGTSLDLIDVCVQLNLSELRLLQYLRNIFNSNCINSEAMPNLVEPSKWAEWCDYLKVALKKNYQHLQYVKVIVRLSRGKYLLNPYLFMSSKNYRDTVELWELTFSKLEKDN